ncbi:hypothetical protein IQ254_06165 [Nodosilinea sp. LEGE 07088]|uniref:hypothetical protein n=1 Tax=Nodosilinea sp. LEGE 07088 TaxID=2777968 RepID=UPI0018802A1B|nr:hypothetical protein [Nodosilinea sp. LEGE 07088]MBE9136792.1 hypothetical protein [Nodosilinea sp. LEGE 07088]
MAVKRYLWCWVVRFGANYAGLAVLTAIAGYIVVALLLLKLMVTGGEAHVSRCP